MRMSRVLASVLIVASASSFAQDVKTRWVDSTFAVLKKEERIGQLFVLPMSSSRDNFQTLLNQTKAGSIGGLILGRTSPGRYARMINTLQANSKVPLIVGADIEPDATATFDSTLQFFNADVINAVANDSLKNLLSRERKRQIDLLQIHFS